MSNGSKDARPRKRGEHGQPQISEQQLHSLPHKPRRLFSDGSATPEGVRLLRSYTDAYPPFWFELQPLSSMHAKTRALASAAGG